MIKIKAFFDCEINGLFAVLIILLRIYIRELFIIYGNSKGKNCCCTATNFTKVEI